VKEQVNVQPLLCGGKKERVIFVFGIDKMTILCQYIVDEQKS
jgi:hypothetical protein